MFRFQEVPVMAGRSGWMTVGVVVGMLSIGALAQAAQPPAAPAAQAQATKNPYVFASDGAVILNFIKADKTADFEMVIGKLKEALAKSPKPERKEQAAGWKFFKAAEAGPGGSVIYISIMSPTVKGADYSVSTILAEVLPAESAALYKAYSEAYGSPSQNILNLTLTLDLGK